MRRYSCAGARSSQVNVTPPSSLDRACLRNCFFFRDTIKGWWLEVIMVYLRISDPQNPRQIEITKPKTIIGRSPDCDVQLDSGDVSRHHAQIVCEAGHYLIEDLNSHNGTSLNGKTLVGPTLLSDCDRIRICEFLILFQMDPSKSSVPAADEAAVAEAPPPVETPIETPEATQLLAEEPAPTQVLTGEPAAPDAPVENSDKTQLLPEEAERTQILAEDTETTKILSAQDAASPDGITHIGTAVRPEVKLRAVLEISRNLSTALRLQDLLPRILESLFQIFPQADHGAILLQEKNTANLVPAAIRNRHDPNDQSLRVSQTMVSRILESRQAILVADTLANPAFDSSKSVVANRIRSVMGVPLMDPSNQPIGLLAIHTADHLRPFTDEDLDLLCSVAGIVAVAVFNAQLNEELLGQERLKQELLVARDVQRGFLPTGLPQAPGYKFFANYEPMEVVSGDYYDFIELPENLLAITLGDVAGKGIAAALLMANLASDVRFSAVAAPDPAAAMRMVNSSLRDAAPGNKFVTLLFIVLDKARHAIAVVNAGHPPPLLRAPSGEITEVGADRAGSPLNLRLGDDAGYETALLPLEAGCVLMLYTDGVTDARNAAGEAFGLQRLRDILQQAPADPHLAGEMIVAEVRKFAGDTPHNDDITLVCFGRLPEPTEPTPAN
jgi:serine phosphatase RsbU (regulator of sigma subunit)/pSer/pThr/pTyr-binding forkhead associated (FHA) protein